MSSFCLPQEGMGLGEGEAKTAGWAGFCISKRIYKVNLPLWLEAKEGEMELQGLVAKDLSLKGRFSVIFQDSRA